MKSKSTKDEFKEVVDKIISSKLQNIKDTEKESLVKNRIGQSTLRELIIKTYNNTCAMCVINDERLLRASHIKKWSEDSENRLNPSNVLCLCGLHDLAFENGIVVVDNNYGIIINTKLYSVSSELEKITLPKLRMPVNKDFFPDKNFLRKHYDFFKGK